MRNLKKHSDNEPNYKQMY